MPPPPQTALVRYGYGVLSVILAAGVAVALDPFDLEGFVFVTAVALAVWFGGRGPGLLASALSILVLRYFFSAPAGTGSTLAPLTYFAFFAALAVLITLLSESRHRAERSLVQTQAELEAQVRERTAALQRSNDQLRAEAAERQRTEEESRKRATLLNLAHDAVIARDLDSRITFWNRGAEQTYGWTAAEALGKLTHELLQTTFPVPLATIEAVICDEARWEGELRHVRRDGTQLVVASRWSLQRDERDAPLAILEINRDITDRKRAEVALQERERELRMLVDSFPGMVLVANTQGIQQYCNKRTTDFLGKPPLEITGSDAESAALVVYENIHPDDLMPLAETWLRANRAGEALDYHYRLRRFDGVYRWISSRAEPLLDEHGNITRWYILLIDVDDQKSAEEALRASQAALAHVTRVATLGEVAASLAHEVNQPLAAIVNNANACLGLLQAGTDDLGEVRDALGDIVSDAERTSAIIQRIRALARRSSSERTPVILADLVGDVLALAATESAARGMTIRADVPAGLPVVAGDRVQLQQVLLNLVINAMDAMTGTNGADRVLEIRARQDTGNGTCVATVSVQDRGVGLDGVEIGRLFEPFYTTKSEGMGMGLAISRSIIEAHGGRLWAEPNRGPGATFSFSLPADPASET